MENFNRTPARIGKIQSVLSKRSPSLTVVLENISDIHNFSAVLRSCDAVGIMESHLVYTGSQELPRLKPGNFSSGSASKWVKTIKHNSISDCYSVLRAEGKAIYTTHLNKDAVSIYNLDLTEPIALVFGNEHSGISEEAHQLADGNFCIPQVGMVESLNISVACAVSLFEAFRQRLDLGMYNLPQYDAEKLNQHFEEWLSL